MRPVGRQRLDASLRPMERLLRAATGFYWLKLPTASPCTTPGQGHRGDLRGLLQLIQHTTAVTASPEHIRTQLKRLVGPSWQTPKLASHLLGCRIDYR